MQLRLDHKGHLSNPDVTYAAQTSTDLKTWSPVANVSAPDANNNRTATVSIPGAAQRFLRLVVTRGAGN